MKTYEGFWTTGWNPGPVNRPASISFEGWYFLNVHLSTNREISSDEVLPSNIYLFLLHTTHLEYTIKVLMWDDWMLNVSTYVSVGLIVFTFEINPGHFMWVGQLPWKSIYCWEKDPILKIRQRKKLECEKVVRMCPSLSHPTTHGSQVQGASAGCSSGARSSASLVQIIKSFVNRRCCVCLVCRLLTGAESLIKNESFKSWCFEHSGSSGAPAAL